MPTLEGDDGAVLTQSLAIIEWLDETHPNPPLLPKDPLRRAKVRAFAHGARLRYRTPCKISRFWRGCASSVVPEEKVTEWAAWANREGLSACETLVAGEAGPFCFGDKPDACRPLPGPAAWQCAALWRRCFGLSAPAEAEAAAREMKAFADAAPDKQADAE